MKKITRTVWILSLVSLFTDMASEMLYPIMPIYLKSIGFSIVVIGILEGIAEAIAGLSKAWFGNLSDQSGKRLPFIQFGYALSSISKPMMAFFVWPVWIFFVRTIDRLGKGIRTGARDAMLSEQSSPETKATIFGFHKSMDTFGAVLGPAFALIWLYFHPESYTTLFLIAFIPGLLAITSTLFLSDKKESKPAVKTNPKPTSFFVFFAFWRNSPPGYKDLCMPVLIFALINSSDVFLLLQAKNAGFNDTAVIGLYIFYNLIFALSAFPLGILADKIGKKRIMIVGFVIFAGVYSCISFAHSIFQFGLIFFFYGLYAAATDGISKAMISNLVSEKQIATAMGTYTGFQSVAALIASSLAGILWYLFGHAATFLFTASIALLVALYLFFTYTTETPENAK